LAKKKQEQEIEAQKRREIEQRAHLARLDAIEAQIAKEHQAREDARLKKERSQAIKQKEDDLNALIASRAEPTVPHPPVSAPPAPVVQSSTLLTSQQKLPSPSEISATASSMLSQLPGRDVGTLPDNASSNSSLPPVKAETTSQMPSSSAPPKPFPKLAESPSKKEWLRLKNMEGASIPSIDAIMGMTGLEEVKKKVLNIKNKIDLCLRQNASLKQERFNAVLLGNPGTGGRSRLIFEIYTNVIRENHRCTALREIPSFCESHTRRSIHRDHRFSISQRRGRCYQKNR
jgi:hypothetical protein